MDSEESILANRICGCATNQQHSADVAAICEYRTSVVAPLLAHIEALEARVRELTIALHDAIRRPMGQVPESADPFYSPRMADEAERRRVGRSNALSNLIAADADLIVMEDKNYKTVCDETEGDGA